MLRTNELCFSREALGFVISLGNRMVQRAGWKTTNFYGLYCCCLRGKYAALVPKSWTILFPSVSTKSKRDAKKKKKKTGHVTALQNGGFD